MASILFHPEAEGELHDAVVWYEHQSKGLGSEFLLCIDEAVERIQRNPESFPVVHRGFRRAVVKRFPFAVFFEVHKSEIRVQAVFHSRRDPSRWQSRG
ncbi:MAG: type II toxin-antitoxin system RelE/ParE family toxin [Bacteroidota bacterium]